MVQCNLSGRKGDIPLIIRADITLSVSKTGTAKTDKVNGTNPTPFAINTVLAGLEVRIDITKIAIMVPISKVPPSPMNIFDLLPNTL